MPTSIMIIGVGPRIGRAVAESFGHEDWIVILTGRNTFRLAAQAAELTAQGISLMPCTPTPPDLPSFGRP